MKMTTSFNTTKAHVVLAILLQLLFLTAYYGVNGTSSVELRQTQDDVVVKEDQSSLSYKKSSISLVELQTLLQTEIDDEVDAFMKSVKDRNNGPRNLQESPTTDAQDIFDHIVTHAWALSSKSTSSNDEDGQINQPHQGYYSRLLSSSKEDEIPFPFLVCSRTPLLQSGIQRLGPMLQFTGAEANNAIVVSNEELQSCFHISTTFSKASVVDSSLSNDEYAIIPMADLMKISSNTFKIVDSKTWLIPSPEESIRSRLKGDEYIEWERILRIRLVTGIKLRDQNDLEEEAQLIVETVKNLGLSGSRRNKRRFMKAENVTNYIHNTPSVSDLFSMTSRRVGEGGRRMQEHLLNLEERQWSRSLQKGIEAEHFCQVMFEQLETRYDSDMLGFSVVLNPSSSTDAFMNQNSDSSASSKDCVKSLIIGISTHPHVLNIEAEMPISTDDFEALWITQSNIQGKTPFSDRGLTGSGQIVSVVDSGLDINHKYFGPTTEEIFQKWIMSERKVVKYDHIRGDKLDAFQGHGTRVAGVIAGNGKDDADGIAKDAKIHVWDLNRQGQMTAPGPELFSSMYNNGNGAKIANLSWSSGFRPYTTRCQIYDSYLRDKFDDVLFVASAGNAANDVPGKVKYTIGDPSSCKNVLSVGASQSHGKRLFPGDKGKDYLADFSSRGPTSDDRMKPDLVAPGYKILAPRAHAQANSYDETYETFGTSFSAPVVSGNAALARQYFEEGWFPCGVKGCNKKRIKPSGSLLKAVLMNGAIQTISHVQKVPAGIIMEQVKEYDNNAGMGLVNLENSLPVKGLNDMNAMVINNESIRDGERSIFTLKTKRCSKPMDVLRATLAWYDKGSAQNCAKCLINDLDLIVEKVDSKKQYYPNGLNGKDNKNNVERVRISDTSPSVYTVTVKASNLATQNQNYSLIITGCFEQLD